MLEIEKKLQTVVDGILKSECSHKASSYVKDGEILTTSACLLLHKIHRLYVKYLYAELGDEARFSPNEEIRKNAMQNAQTHYIELFGSGDGEEHYEEYKRTPILGSPIKEHCAPFKAKFFTIHCLFENHILEEWQSLFKSKELYLDGAIIDVSYLL